ncbi:MAG: hypothetical protein U1F66_10945 [bacterium]
MPNTKRIPIILGLIALIIPAMSCRRSGTPGSQQTSKPAPADSAKPAATPTPTPVPNAPVVGKAFHISGHIDDAAQEGDVCDVSVTFTVPGTLKFEFTPTSARKGNYTYSGPFNATGSGPYEIFENGKMLVSGTGCIMGKCATYSHDWKAEPIDPAKCGKAK